MINRNSSTTPLVWSTLILILILAAVLRFSGLDREGRWGDEYRQTRSYTLSLHSVVEEARSAGQPPLDYLLGWALARLDQSDRMRRVPAAFFGVAGVAVLFFLVRRLTSSQEGLIAAALLALSPLHWALSQEARPYAICTAFLLLTFWTLARALDRPDTARLIAYGVVCYLFTLTRGLLPLVVLSAIGLVLSALWLFYGRRERPRPHRELAALRRLWCVTVIVAVATVPMVLYLLTDEAYTVFSDVGRRAETVLGMAPWARVGANLVRWIPLGGVMFGATAPLVIWLAIAGILLRIQRRGVISLGARCVYATMVVVGPLYLLSFSACVPVAPIRIRYGLFLTPIVAAFAASALGGVFQWLNNAATTRVLGRISTTMVMLIVLAGPAARTFGLSDKYFRPDWRGCAMFLFDRVQGEDVIMVFEDRPVGEPRMTFWGKYDWPVNMDKPLAEPIRSLAQSESHWKRLCRRTGRCIVVIRSQVGAETKGEYLSRGMQEAPDGMVLTKFRGLDVLERMQLSDDPVDRMIDACNDLLRLPKEHREGDAFLLALRSRLQLYQGDTAGALDSYERAKQILPVDLRGWFAGELAVHAAALAQVGAVTQSVEPEPFGYAVTEHDVAR